MQDETSIDDLTSGREVYDDVSGLPVSLSRMAPYILQHRKANQSVALPIDTRYNTGEIISHLRKQNEDINNPESWPQPFESLFNPGKEKEEKAKSGHVYAFYQ